MNIENNHQQSPDSISGKSVVKTVMYIFLIVFIIGLEYYPATLQSALNPILGNVSTIKYDGKNLDAGAFLMTLMSLLLLVITICEDGPASHQERLIATFFGTFAAKTCTVLFWLLITIFFATLTIGKFDAFVKFLE